MSNTTASLAVSKAAAGYRGAGRKLSLPRQLGLQALLLFITFTVIFGSTCCFSSPSFPFTVTRFVLGPWVSPGDHDRIPETGSILMPEGADSRL